MSRHSKNNTANPVFTYAERKMIKDFGKQKARIGSDSQKPFEFCYLCVTKVVDPLCCCKGHIFCRECIINNLVKQKEDNAKLLEAYEKQQKLLEQKKQEDDQAQQKQREQDFEKLDYQNDILERKHFKSKVEQKMQGYIHQDQDMQFRALDQMKQKGNEMLTRTKEDLISKNFWVPDTQKAEEPKIMNQPSKSYKCPATKDHEVKMRKLYKVQFNENSKEVFCYACNKTLRYQKTAMSKHCGHVMCLDCLNKMCLPDERCLVCSIPFKKTDIILLKESSSGFSSHNQVEVTVFNPVMLI